MDGSPAGRPGPGESGPQDEFAAALAPILAAMADAEPIPVRDWARRRHRIERAFRRLAGSLAVPPGVSAFEARLANGVALRIYEPAGPVDITLVYAHGGGRFACSVDTYDPVARCYAGLGVRVVAVDYRLPPETPLPGAIEDIVAALAWSRERSGPGARIVLGGDSGGAGLAASAALMSRDRRQAGAVQPDGVLLVYPMLDDRTRIGPRLAPERLLWTPDDNACAWAVSTPDPDLPYLVPARAGDLAGLPAVYLEVGTADLFLAETLAFAERLVSAGNRAVVRVVEHAPHAYDLVAPDALSVKASWYCRQQFLLNGRDGGSSATATGEQDEHDADR